MNILVVIPARGGSKGIPRKNLRFLDGKPLLFYSINNALSSKYKSDIYVSSEDDEILDLAKKLNVNIHKRDITIAKDSTTLDPVIYDCYTYAKKNESKQYDLIVTMQPTSPLLDSKSLDLAIDKIINDNKIDTIIAATDSTHLSWKKKDAVFLPNYKQQLHQ